MSSFCVVMVRGGRFWGILLSFWEGEGGGREGEGGGEGDVGGFFSPLVFVEGGGESTSEEREGEEEDEPLLEKGDFDGLLETRTVSPLSSSSPPIEEEGRGGEGEGGKEGDDFERCLPPDFVVGEEGGREGDSGAPELLLPARPALREEEGVIGSSLS